jgi:hypothetical protein
VVGWWAAKVREVVYTLALVTATLFCAGAVLAAAPVPFVCSGPKVAAARQVAKDDNLTLGMDAKACFGEMQLTESARKQLVVAVPSEQCKAGKLLNVYDRSRAGSWYALFTQPACGTAIAVGPKSPYGDTMITIDGRHYIDKAGAFVPFQ